jgi:hypothetical protein
MSLATCYLATTFSLLFIVAGTWFSSHCSVMDICSCSTIPAGSQPSCHFALSLKLLVPNSLTVYHSSFFSEDSARDVFLWLGLNRGDQSPTATNAPSLRVVVSNFSLIRFQSIQVYHHHPEYFFYSDGGKITPSGRWSHISCSSYANSATRFCFHFGGVRLLHNIQSLFFRNPTVDLEIRFAIASPVVFL